MIYRILEEILECLPNCRAALRLSEKGVERPLKWHERAALTYHRPLCPFCACNRNKFESLEQRRLDVEAERRNKPSCS